jgi:hypothetical protein
VIVVALFAVMALCAAGVETGHVYYAYRLLQASTQVATLAGAQAMPNITQAGKNVTAYSSESGQSNASNLLQVTNLSTNFYCSGNATALNVGCEAPQSGSCSGSATTCNALTVTQTAKVNLWLGGLVGVRSMTMTATSSASMSGGTNTPYNIAIIIDTTGSMGSTRATGECPGSNPYQIQCAIYGLQQFLLKMDPCPLNTTCSKTTAYVDDVALYVFPAVAGAPSSSGVAGDASDDTVCPTSNPPTVPYNFTNVSSTGQDLNLWDATKSGTAVADANYQGAYEVVNFNNTYKANDTSQALATSGDPLAVAAGGGSCQGLEAPGGQATYYAQVIRAAQAGLVAAHTANPNSQNVMIILTDGDATACNLQANSAAGGTVCTSNHNDIVADNCPAINSTGGCVASADTSNPCPPASTSPSNSGGGCYGTPLNGTMYTSTGRSPTVYDPPGYQSATYPSALGQCGQAVEAAQMATYAGTAVYTVAMGSETSGGCLTDAHYTVSDSYTGSTYGFVAWNGVGGQPCNAIQAMASPLKYSVKGKQTFYSDSSAGCSAPAGTPTYTTIGGIFNAIAGGLSSARLIPTGT